MFHLLYPKTYQECVSDSDVGSIDAVDGEENGDGCGGVDADEFRHSIPPCLTRPSESWSLNVKYWLSIFLLPLFVSLVSLSSCFFSFYRSHAVPLSLFPLLRSPLTLLFLPSSWAGFFRSRNYFSVSILSFSSLLIYSLGSVSHLISILCCYIHPSSLLYE